MLDLLYCLQGQACAEKAVQMWPHGKLYWLKNQKLYCIAVQSKLIVSMA